MQTFDIIKHYKHIKQIGHLIQPQKNTKIKDLSTCKKTIDTIFSVLLRQRTNQGS